MFSKSKKAAPEEIKPSFDFYINELSDFLRTTYEVLRHTPHKYADILITSIEANESRINTLKKNEKWRNNHPYRT